MAIPIYDQTVLPCITYPLKNTKEVGKKYLGAVGIVGKTKAEINIVAITDAKLNALHTFWRVDCNYGLEPFFLQMPLFGTNQIVLAKFNSDFVPTKDDVKWSMTISLDVLKYITYVVDDNGDYVVSDTEAYVVTNDIILETGDIINFDRSILWL